MAMQCLPSFLVGMAQIDQMRYLVQQPLPTHCQLPMSIGELSVMISLKISLGFHVIDPLAARIFHRGKYELKSFLVAEWLLYLNSNALVT